MPVHPIVPPEIPVIAAASRQAPKLELAAVAVLAALGAYAITRGLERSTLRRLPIVADLAEYSLPKLYRAATRAERARLRAKRKASRSRVAARLVGLALGEIRLFRMRQLGLVRSRAYRGARLEQTLQRAMRAIDDVVDGDLVPTSGTRQQFFDHTTRVLDSLAKSRRLLERAMPEDLPLVYTLLASRRLLGIDVLPDMLELWADYTPDALRIIRGEPVPSRMTIERAHRAYVRLGYIGGLLQGLSSEQALMYARLDVPSLTAWDNITDLLRDVRRRQLSVSREELVGHGISPERLLEADASWDDVARVPGVARWCLAQTEALAATWESALPRLLEAIAPSIRPRLARSWAVKGWRYRRAMLVRLERKWQRYVSELDGAETESQAASAVSTAGAVTRCDADQFSAPRYHRFASDDDLSEDAPAALLTAPSGWLAIADALAAAADTFGLSVSSATRERWRRFWACAWILDQLLDESPDPGNAPGIFRQIVRGPTPHPDELPGWVSPAVLPAVGLLKSSLSELGAREQVIEGILEIGEYGFRKAAQRKLLPYLRTVVAEDRATGWLAAGCVSDTERESPAFAAFRRWCGWFVTFGGTFDAAVDLRQDHRMNRAGVRPTRRNRLILAGCSWVVFAACAARYPRAFLAVARSVDEYRRAGVAATAPH